jgi:hypothetical protein
LACISLLCLVAAIFALVGGMDSSDAGGSTEKPGRCFASITAPKAMADSPQAQVSAANPHLQRVEDNAFHEKETLWCVTSQ